MNINLHTRLIKEKEILAPYSVFSADSKGRAYQEPESEDRSCFQRDRDRIIHTKSWRRLKHKTQVFVALEGDHFRDRLTHSLEVAQISRDLARSLFLNEDLAESIALAHDLGHTPFGHVGEETLNQLLKPLGESFEHNRQSRRIIEEIERIYPDFPGLNLSFEVRDGMIKHQSCYDQADLKIRIHPSLEAQIVNLADEIAYNSHDLDDGLRSGILNLKEVTDLQIWRTITKSLSSRYEKLPDPKEFPQRYIGHLIHVFCRDIFSQTQKNIESYSIKTLKDVYSNKDYLVSFSPQFMNEVKELRAFLKEKLYFSDYVRGKMQEGREIIVKIFNSYLQKPNLLPTEIASTIHDEKTLAYALRDYIAGMTDNFARDVVSEM